MDTVPKGTAEGRGSHLSIQGMAAAELSPKLLRILHSTLREVERQLEAPEGDLVLRALKQSIVQAISQLELERVGASPRMGPLRDSSHARVDDGGSG